MRLLPPPSPIGRRRVLKALGAAGLAAAVPTLLARPALARAGRPVIGHGVQAGDLGRGGAVIWSRADRPSRMVVEWATTESFRDARRIHGPAALEVDDFTAKLTLGDLPPGQDVFYRVTFESLEDPGALSEPVAGRFRTAPAVRRDIRFVWTADTAGQGWGLNEDWGGLRGYAAMAEVEPDFLVHSGDTIYADDPLAPEVPLPDGTVWRNLVTEEKSKVAETLDEFRGNFRYNLMDETLRAFNAQVPIFAQWDDHEVTNNWFPGWILDDPRYTVRSASLLAARANRAFREYLPIRESAAEPGRIYRRIPYGPSLDIFVLDKRSYRGPNVPNDQTERSPETDFLGPEQLLWLKRALLASRATWKVIASSMPIGVIVYHDFRTRTGSENVANRDGPPEGRELELADLLRFIRDNGIRNTVWITGDVHYAAAHHFHPDRARFRDFAPFWEFVAGPIHAGSFGPNTLDDTFGPEVVFARHPDPGLFNLPPSAGLQFFGQVDIDGATEALTVTLKSIERETLYSVTLEPDAA